MTLKYTHFESINYHLFEAQKPIPVCLLKFEKHTHKKNKTTQARDWYTVKKLCSLTPQNWRQLLSRILWSTFFSYIMLQSKITGTLYILLV